MSITAKPVGDKWSVELRRGDARHEVLLSAADEFAAIAGAQTLLEIWHRNYVRANRKAG